MYIYIYIYIMRVSISIDLWTSLFPRIVIDKSISFHVSNFA